MYEQKKPDRIMLHHNALKPKLGTFIVSRKAPAALTNADLGQDINMIATGFETSKLETIVAALAKEGGRIE